MCVVIISLAPSAPIIKNLTVIDSRSVYVEWNIPSDTNGALTTYTIYYSNENGAKRNLMVPFNRQNVSDLIQSHIYSM